MCVCVTQIDEGPISRRIARRENVAIRCFIIGKRGLLVRDGVFGYGIANEGAEEEEEEEKKKQFFAYSSFPTAASSGFSSSIAPYILIPPGELFFSALLLPVVVDIVLLLVFDSNRIDKFQTARVVAFVSESSFFFSFFSFSMAAEAEAEAWPQHK
uniref:Uncharacterized protein n=1 Tax=Caenorhabditis tropicalis TaxID=1561998 RepID=A0A1I7TEQ7_9PELO